MKSIVMTTLSLIAAMTAPAEAGQTPPLTPTGKWTVDYADAACILSRDYGSGDARTTLGINPSPLASSLVLVTVSPGAKTTRYRPMKGTLTLQPSGRMVDSDTWVYEFKAKDQTVTTLTTEGDVEKELLHSSSLSVTLADGSRTAFALPGIERAAGSLRACQDDLLRRWGIDPAERDLPPLPGGGMWPAQWITPDDYPRSALETGVQGKVTVVWTIQTDGRVGDCRVVDSSQSKELDDAACSAISKRGHYSPPLGIDGKSQVRHGMRRIIWRLPFQVSW